MEYPEHLMPTKKYKILNCIDDLKNCYLLRITPDSDLVNPDTGGLKLEYVIPPGIQTKNLGDYSTNLFGNFTYNDRTWVFIGDNKKYFSIEDWIQGEEIKLKPVYENDFIKDDGKGAYFLKITEIENITVEYNKGETSGFIAVCKIKHTPKRANFWHISIRWHDEDGNDFYPKRVGKNWTKNMLKTAFRTRILESAILETPECIPMSEELFMN